MSLQAQLWLSLPKHAEQGFKLNMCSSVQNMNYAGHSTGVSIWGGGGALRPLGNQEYITHHLECKFPESACRFQKEKGGLTLQIACNV
jgi:hypothetical protein